MLRRQAELHSGQGAGQLITGARTDDWCGDRGPGEQPGEAQRAGFCADLHCQVLVRLDLVPMLSEALRGAALQSPDASAFFLDHSTEQAPPAAVTRGMIPSP